MSKQRMNAPEAAFRIVLLILGAGAIAAGVLASHKYGATYGWFIAMGIVLLLAAGVID